MLNWASPVTSLRLINPKESFMPDTRPWYRTFGEARSTRVTFLAHIDRFLLSVATKNDTLSPKMS